MKKLDFTTSNVKAALKAEIKEAHDKAGKCMEKNDFAGMGKYLAKCDGLYVALDIVEQYVEDMREEIEWASARAVNPADEDFYKGANAALTIALSRVGLG